MTYVHRGTLPDSSDTLGGVALPVQTRWINQRQFVPYSESRRVSVAGSSDYLVMSLIGGQPIDLSIQRPYSWLYAAKYTALQALLSPAGQTLVLFWQGATINVRFRQFDPPALAFNPLEKIGNQPAPVDLQVFEGVIKLITV